MDWFPYNQLNLADKQRIFKETPMPKDGVIYYSPSGYYVSSVVYNKLAAGLYTYKWEVCKVLTNNVIAVRYFKEPSNVKISDKGIIAWAEENIIKNDNEPPSETT